MDANIVLADEKKGGKMLHARRMFETDVLAEVQTRRSFLLVPIDGAGNVDPKRMWHLVASPCPYLEALPLKKGESQKDTLYKLLVQRSASWDGNLRTKISQSAEPISENPAEGVVLFHRHGEIDLGTRGYSKLPVSATFALLPEGFHIECFLEELKSEAERFQALSIIKFLSCELGGVLFPSPKVSKEFLNWVRESKELAFVLSRYQKLLRRTMKLKWEHECGHWTKKNYDRCLALKGWAEELSLRARTILLVVGDDFHFAEAMRCIETDCDNVAASVSFRLKFQSVARSLGQKLEDMPFVPESEAVKIKPTPEMLALNRAVEIRYYSVLLATKPSGGWIDLGEGRIRNHALEWFENAAGEKELGHPDAAQLGQSPQWLSPY